MIIMVRNRRGAEIMTTKLMGMKLIAVLCGFWEGRAGGGVMVWWWCIGVSTCVALTCWWWWWWWWVGQGEKARRGSTLTYRTVTEAVLMCTWCCWWCVRVIVGVYVMLCDSMYVHHTASSTPATTSHHQALYISYLSYLTLPYLPHLSWHVYVQVPRLTTLTWGRRKHGLKHWCERYIILY